jgi:hypothetical protein
MSNIVKSGQVRIHAYMGGIHELFGKFIGNIPVLVRGYTHYMKKGDYEYQEYFYIIWLL